MATGIPSMQDIQKQQEKEQQLAQQKEQKAMILDQIMEPNARERLQRLGLVKPEKLQAVEESLIRAAQNGQLKSKVTDAQLITMLESVGGEDDGPSAGGRKKIVMQRKKYADDSESDNDDDLL